MFPVNRIIAFIGPYIAIGSGAVADWLFVHLHFLALFHTTHTQVAAAITQVVVFGVTALLVWLGHQKFLTGWQQWERLLGLDHQYQPPVVQENPPTSGRVHPVSAEGQPKSGV